MRFFTEQCTQLLQSGKIFLASNKVSGRHCHKKPSYKVEFLFFKHFILLRDHSSIYFIHLRLRQIVSLSCPSKLLSVHYLQSTTFYPSPSLIPVPLSMFPTLHPCTLKGIFLHTHTHKHTPTHAHSNTYTHLYTHTPTHTHTHIHTHTHTHTHTLHTFQ